MKYLIISDIHGSLPRLERALKFFEREQFDMLLILGDILNYGPRNSIPEGIDAKGIVAWLNPLADRIVAVRGNCDAEVDQMLLQFPMMADYVLVVDNGRKLFLTHGPCLQSLFYATGTLRRGVLWSYASMAVGEVRRHGCL